MHLDDEVKMRMNKVDTVLPLGAYNLAEKDIEQVSTCCEGEY